MNRRMTFEDVREEHAVPTADVDDMREASKIADVEDGLGEARGAGCHGSIEDHGFFAMLHAIVPDVAAVHAIKRGVASPDRLQQIAPGIPDIGPAEQFRHRRTGPLGVPAQKLTHG